LLFLYASLVLINEDTLDYVTSIKAGAMHVSTREGLTEVILGGDTLDSNSCHIHYF